MVITTLLDVDSIHNRTPFVLYCQKYSVFCAKDFRILHELADKRLMKITERYDDEPLILNKNLRPVSGDNKVILLKQFRILCEIALKSKDT